MIFLGIDPGKSGGVFAFGDLRIPIIHKCPDTIKDMAELIWEIKSLDARYYTVIELVHSFPGNGSVSSFKFGRNYGEWLGILAALSMPYVQVSPNKWMKHFGAMPKEKKDRKNHIKHLAQQRFPDLKITLATSDAVLMALYAKDIYK
jgi:hypothetical protein